MAWRFTKSQTGYLDEYWGLDSSGNCCLSCVVPGLSKANRRMSQLQGVTRIVSCLVRLTSAQGIGSSCVAPIWSKRISRPSSVSCARHIRAAPLRCCWTKRRAIARQEPKPRCAIRHCVDLAPEAMCGVKRDGSAVARARAYLRELSISDHRGACCRR